MGRNSKRLREIAKLVDRDTLYSLEEAVDILKRCFLEQIERSSVKCNVS